MKHTVNVTIINKITKTATLTCTFASTLQWNSTLKFNGFHESGKSFWLIWLYLRGTFCDFAVKFLKKFCDFVEMNWPASLHDTVNLRNCRFGWIIQCTHCSLKVSRTLQAVFSWLHGSGRGGEPWITPLLAVEMYWQREGSLYVQKILQTKYW